MPHNDVEGNYVWEPYPTGYANVCDIHYDSVSGLRCGHVCWYRG
jgi:hypothetical protein